MARPLTGWTILFLPVGHYRLVERTMAVPAWDDEARERFRKAQAAYDDDQTACAYRLISLGAPDGTRQPTISEWLNSRSPRVATRAVIFRYIDDAPVESDGRSPPDGQSDEDRVYQTIVRDMTGEPMVGPRQGAFLDAWIERSRAGPATSPDDTIMRRDLMKTLGLLGG